MTVSTIQIEKPGIDKMDQVLKLWEGQHKLHIGLDPIKNRPWGDEIQSEMRDYMGKAIEKDIPHLRVACVGDEVIGFITFSIEKATYLDTGIRTYGQIIEIYIDPNHQGSGVGKALMHVAEQFFRDHHVKHSMAQMSSFNSDAQGFYEKQGFVSRSIQWFKQLD